MTKTELEKRMRAFAKKKKVNDEQLFTLVMLTGFSGEPEKERTRLLLDTLLNEASARMDNLKAMSDGYKGNIKATYNGNMYLLANILTSNLPIRKKLIVSIALVNAMYERLK